MADRFLFESEKDYLGFAEYADRHGLQDIFQHLLRLLLVDRPEDPVKFMIDHVTNPITPAVVVSAPPSSGRDEMCRLLAAKLGAVYVSTGNLLRAAVEKQTSLGNQVKPYMEKNQLVPDAIISGVLFERLKEDDVRQRGWVLDGFPRTREQALAMQRRGALPTHFVRLDIPDAAILEHTSQLRVDPVTGKSYHLRISPPPQGGGIAGRLQQRSYHSRAAVAARLELFRRNSPGVLGCFSHLTRGVSFDAGLFGAEAAAADRVAGILARAEPYGRVAAGPKCYKVCVCGGPGAGKTMIAEVLRRGFFFVWWREGGGEWGTMLLRREAGSGGGSVPGKEKKKKKKKGGKSSD
ncbi:MAG: adenylate kinase-domain-containing protein [Olpidium bornovanus]|uniref:Adenylate kinase-domain-containing protein n=1 Tax=Olpidium bornovanus TaxID=278681 RepID=A0A8H7ZQ71_9FUNG|nr:MAG: adenylate kinase-domain-containing protein [Olpidium bornovanus]